MNYSKVLTIQDISCVGQCSLTVALPIISACGSECCILPSAVLSTHTAGFKGFTCRDLSDDIPAIEAHWQKENISFDAVYTGYLGSIPQIAYVKDIMAKLVKPNGLKIVDPAMGDGGRLYPAFDQAYADEMATLCRFADITIPNITEACFMTGIEYKEVYDKAYVMTLSEALTKGTKTAVVLTGVSYRPGETGVVVYQSGDYQYYAHKKLPQSYHGTGDVYASAFVGALMQQKNKGDLMTPAGIAADYVVSCIEATIGDDNHKYGVKFETQLPKLWEMIQKA